MYEYLIANLIGFIILLVIYGAVPRLRRALLWGSFIGAGIVVGLAIILNITLLFGLDVMPKWVPNYWDPPQLFDFARKYQVSIEDALFYIVMGGIVSVIYEIATRRFIRDHSKRQIHIDAILLAIALFFLSSLTNINAIYALIIAQTVTGAYIVVRRPDLLRHELVASVLFVVFYALFFWFVLLIWPHFINYWNLKAISGILIAGIPLEELLWAASHGLFFGPLYEYVRHAHIEK